MTHSEHDYHCSGMLHQILSSGDYALALTPGFFRFYALIGVLQALEERNCLRPSHVSGASAGALVGMEPSAMIKSVLRIKRADIWDTGGTGGLLKGGLFQELLERDLPVQTIENCRCPLGVTTFDLGKFQTKHITKGHLATAMRASCTFPGLFQPVTIGGSPNIDGGVFDGVGLMALPHALGLDDDVTHCDHPSITSPVATSTSRTAASGKNSNSKRTSSNNNNRSSTGSTSGSAVQAEASDCHLVVNVVFGKASMSTSALPPQLTAHKLLTIVVEGVPMVHPFSMDTMGIVAYKVARAAMLKALHSSHMQELTSHHWCCYVDGTGIKLEDYPLPVEASPAAAPAEREVLRASLHRRGTSDASSSDSAHIEHSWSTAPRRRVSKRVRSSTTLNASAETGVGVVQDITADSESPRKVARSNAGTSTNTNTSTNAPAVSGEEAARSGDEQDSVASSGASECEDEGEEQEGEDGKSRLSRRAYMSIPSFSFLNGTYRMYSAALDAVHSMEVTGSAILTDATTALSSAKKRLDDSSQVLYQAVRSTIETVVHEIVGPEVEADAEEGAVVTEPVATPAKRRRGTTAALSKRRQSEGAARKVTPAKSPRVTRSAATAVKSKKAPVRSARKSK